MDHAGSQRVSVIGLLSNTGPASLDLWAGRLGHSYALIADAAESLADIVAAAGAWRGQSILPACSASITPSRSDARREWHQLSSARAFACE